MAYTCHLYLYFIQRLGLVRFSGLLLMLERPLSEPPTQSSDEPDFGIRGPMLSFRRVVLPRSLPLISTHVRVLKYKLLFIYLYESEYRTQNTNSIGEDIQIEKMHWVFHHNPLRLGRGFTSMFSLRSGIIRYIIFMFTIGSFGTASTSYIKRCLCRTYSIRQLNRGCI